MMNYFSGSYTDGYADNIALLLTTNRPALTIQGGNNFVVVWTTNFATGYLFQQCTNLASANWATTTNSVVFANGTNQVTVPPIVGNRFFRLYHP